MADDTSLQVLDEQVYQPVFFNKLAQLGIACDTAEQQERLLQLVTPLQQQAQQHKTAGLNAWLDVAEQRLGVAGQKQAAAQAHQQASDIDDMLSVAAQVVLTRPEVGRAAFAVAQG